MRGQAEDRDVSQRPGAVGRIFLLTAMPEEAAALGDDLGCRTWTRVADARFALGSGPYRAVAVGISGMGKVAAAIAAEYACTRWRPWLLVMSGVAGGLRPGTRVGDLVVPSEAIQHDYDARPFAAARSLIPHLGTIALDSDHRVSAIIASACERCLASAAGSQARDRGLRQDTCRVIRGGGPDRRPGHRGRTSQAGAGLRLPGGRVRRHGDCGARPGRAAKRARVGGCPDDFRHGR
jgi:hypothetical protein